ncbi:DgyrCDS7407 [Dimorphilus gyrociliatus]|uniref:DgyrCDS7407 n=1 Tax=Dimorphilus gyrociliatus TaxID=2664684 RepID=A0A7I8VSP1_9ANNE|nr:DgyrCDS7407 [Dimorphilus gyrociliatus]
MNVCHTFKQLIPVNVTIRHSLIVCEDRQQQISCPQNHLIITLSAFYGRRNWKYCVKEHESFQDIPIDKPLIWAFNAQDLFRKTCDKQNTCIMNTSSAFYQNVHIQPMISKYLEIEWSCIECTNHYISENADAECQMWMNEGNCLSHPEWMIPQCRAACWKCSKVELPCENIEKDNLCEFLAAIGECQIRPTYMFAFCRKSCFKCGSSTVKDTLDPKAINLSAECQTLADKGECQKNPSFMLEHCLASCRKLKQPKCQNTYEDKTKLKKLCDDWASAGLCGRNSHFMLKNCFKSCSGCDKEKFNCVNVYDNDYKCDYWHMKGESVRHPKFMARNCTKSLSGCNPSNDVVKCEDDNSKIDMCSVWASEGLCHKNLEYMHAFCRKSCGFCPGTGLQGLGESRIGHHETPGDSSDVIKNLTIVLNDQRFLRNGRLVGFKAYFSNIHETSFQIWRPLSIVGNYEKNNTILGNFYLAYEIERFIPKEPDTVQLVSVKECVDVRAGDLIGFTTFKTASVASHVISVKSSYWVGGMKNGVGRRFTLEKVHYSLVFSLSAVFNEDNCRE